MSTARKNTPTAAPRVAWWSDEIFCAPRLALNWPVGAADCSEERPASGATVVGVVSTGAVNGAGSVTDEPAGEDTVAGVVSGDVTGLSVTEDPPPLGLVVGGSVTAP